MRLSFAMCTLFFLSQGLADNNVIRQKRDMLSIQNFLYSLFGSKPNNRNIYRVVDDENVYVKSMPEYGSNFRKVSIFNPHELIKYRQPNEENGYYSAQISSHNGKSLIKGNLLANNNINKYNNQMFDCNSNSDDIIPEQSKTFIEKPLFIQNRLHDLIMGRTIYLPMATAKIERFIVPENKGEVHVSNYPVKRVPYKEPINIEGNLNVPKSPSLQSLHDNISTTTLTDRAKPAEVMESSRIKTNSPDITKIVRFTEPVHSRYSYKNIYQTQPNQDTIVNNNYSQVASSTVDTVPTVKSAPLKTDSNGLPADFFFLPPISTETGSVYVPINRRKPAQENLTGDNNLDISLKNNALVIFDQRNKRKDRANNMTLQEKQRGDIPEVSS